MGSRTPKATPQWSRYLAGVRGVSIGALPARPGQGTQHQQPKEQDEEPQGVGKDGLSRQELVLRCPVLPWGKRSPELSWMCPTFPFNPAQPLQQGAEQGITHFPLHPGLGFTVGHLEPKPHSPPRTMLTG